MHVALSSSSVSARYIYLSGVLLLDVAGVYFDFFFLKWVHFSFMHLIQVV